MCERLLQDVTKLTDLEFLTLVQTFSFFEYFESEELFGVVVDKVLEQTGHLKLATAARVCFILSANDIPEEKRQALLTMLTGKLDSWLLKKDPSDTFGSVAVVDAFLAVIRLQQGSSTPFKWMGYLETKLERCLGQLSNMLKLVVGWTAALYAPASFQRLLPLLQKTELGDPKDYSFLEKYLANHLQFFLGKPFDGSFFDESFENQLKEFEIKRICGVRIQVEDYERVMEPYFAIFREKFGPEVKTNSVIGTQSGVRAYAPVFLEAQGIVVLVVNDKYTTFRDANTLGAALTLILQAEGVEVRMVSVTDLTGYHMESTPLSPEQIMEYREEVVDRLIYGDEETVEEDEGEEEGGQESETGPKNN